jgi:hypothetical protein
MGPPQQQPPSEDWLPPLEWRACGNALLGGLDDLRHTPQPKPKA